MKLHLTIAWWCVEEERESTVRAHQQLRSKQLALGWKCVQTSIQGRIYTTKPSRSAHTILIPLQTRLRFQIWLAWEWHHHHHGGTISQIWESRDILWNEFECHFDYFLHTPFFFAFGKFCSNKTFGEISSSREYYTSLIIPILDACWLFQHTEENKNETHAIKQQMAFIQPLTNLTVFIYIYDNVQSCICAKQLIKIQTWNFVFPKNIRIVRVTYCFWIK